MMVRARPCVKATLCGGARLSPDGLSSFLSRPPIWYTCYVGRGVRHDRTPIRIHEAGWQPSGQSAEHHIGSGGHMDPTDRVK